VERGTYERFLEVQHIAPTTVVRFKHRTILDSAAIESIGEHLLQLAGEEGRRNFLLNFAGVESLPSVMLGKFVALHHLLSDAGGQLAFCCVDPFLMEIFKIAQIHDRISIHTDEAQALQALSGA
jgi:anti-anti-sigma factor